MLSCCPLNTPVRSEPPRSCPRLCRPQSPACPATHQRLLTSVISREAAAALMCRLGCRMELLQSRALAKVPTALRGKPRRQEGKKAQAGWELSQMRKKDHTQARARMPTPKKGAQNYVHTSPVLLPHPPTPHRATTRNWSICRSVRGLSGSQTFISIFCWFRLSDSPAQRATASSGREKRGGGQNASRRGRLRCYGFHHLSPRCALSLPAPEAAFCQGDSTERAERHCASARHTTQGL